MMEILSLHIFLQMKNMRHGEGEVTQLMADRDLNWASKTLEFPT